MSYKNMQVSQINEGDQKKVSYEYEVNLTAPGNGDAILIPDEITWFSTTMSFTAGASGKVQITTDLVSTVKAGTGITWVDSWWGEADDTYVDVYFPVSAIRAVQIDAGTMKMTVRAQ